MTQPQYAPQQGYAPPAQQPYQPEQGYAPQPQGFAPPQQQYPPQQYAPQQPYGGQQGFAPQPGYGAPQQPFGGQQQAPQQQLAAGSLDQFWAQPSAGGGAALKFEHIGTTYVGRVARPIQDSDIQQQTQIRTNQPSFYKDGRPKFVMRVPLVVAPSADYPDGLAQWYCSGQARDELVRAMAAAGAPAGPPEDGAIISVAWVSERGAGAGMNKAKVYQVHYQRPDGSGQQQQQQAPAPQQPPAQQPAAAPQPPSQPPAAPPAPPPAAPPAPPAQPPAAPPAAPAPEGLSPDQQALYDRLTGAPQS